MSDYAIGDVQGCYEPLLQLMECIDFNEHSDRLWFVGDLVNRGPQSLDVLRFVRSLPIPPCITLGNHDLHLLSSLFCEQPWKSHDDTIHDILNAPDGEELGHWLRQQSILCYSKELNVVMCHAGIAPMWDLEQAIQLAEELESALRGPDYRHTLKHLYGNEPNLWSDDLAGIVRIRMLTNYFTRMRLCHDQGALDFDFKGRLVDAPPHLHPWYDVPGRKAIDVDIVFGHWAALQGACPHARIHAIDTGCLWGGPLTALRLQDKHRFSVPGTGDPW